MVIIFKFSVYYVRMYPVSTHIHYVLFFKRSDGLHATDKGYFSVRLSAFISNVMLIMSDLRRLLTLNYLFL
jgi:hypothetical protein